VALVDLGLPGIDGFEVARRLRAEPGAAGLTLVALTGYGQLDDRRRSADGGFDAHLVKPVTLEQLGGVLALAARPRAAGVGSGRAWGLASIGSGRTGHGWRKIDGCDPVSGPARPRASAPRWRSPRRSASRAAGSCSTATCRSCSRGCRGRSRRATGP